ncbi:MAG: NAD(+)/NADH kinase, partial [Chloroflexi bacterium]|nr:NAD(+)/NADH kinase [Chloroflexota bacterium]
MTEYRNIGIIHHGLLPEAVKLAGLLQSRYAADRQWWSATQDTLASNTHQLQTTDLIVTIGGDGTILRGVHEAAPRGIPVLGVNMGRVGFMSEIDAGDAVD